MKKKMCIKILFAVFFLIGFTVMPLQAKETNVNTETVTYVARKEYNYMFYAPLKGKVTWSVGDKKIARIIGKDGNICKVTMLKDGTTALTAKSKNGKCKFMLNVKQEMRF